MSASGDYTFIEQGRTHPSDMPVSRQLARREPGRPATYPRRSSLNERMTIARKLRLTGGIVRANPACRNESPSALVGSVGSNGNLNLHARAPTQKDIHHQSRNFPDLEVGFEISTLDQNCVMHRQNYVLCANQLADLDQRVLEYQRCRALDYLTQSPLLLFRG